MHLLFWAAVAKDRITVSLTHLDAELFTGPSA
jgi:hypothetical protein